MFYINLKAIHGLNGEQILKKYRKDLKDNTLKHEKQSAEQDAIHKLNDEAEVLLKNNKFEEALAKYTLMSEMPSGVEPAKLGVAKTTKAMKNFNEKMNYFDKIEITEFVAQRVNTYSKNDIPSVRFSLKNRGSRSLDMVKVTVYFRDRQGNIIFEKDFHPVLVSKYSFGDNKPLKPGYVKEIEKDKFYTIDSQLSEWFEGSAFAKITDLKFTE